MNNALEMTPLLIIGALAIGSAVGVLTGLFGVGGGFLITPLLNALLGVPMPIAVGTGAMQILGTATAGLYRRRKEGRVDYKMALVLFGGNVVGVQLGDRLVQWMKGLGMLNIGGTAVAAVDLIIQVVFIVILAAIAGWLWYDASRSLVEATPVGLFSRIHLPPYTDFATLDNPRMSVPLMSYFGVVLGFLTGLLGIGGGVVLVPALLYLVGMRTHRAAATSLAMVWLSSFVAVITKVGQGDANLALAVPLLVGGTVGLQFGVTICNRTNSSTLKRYFTLVVLAACLLVLGKVVSLFL